MPASPVCTTGTRSPARTSPTQWLVLALIGALAVALTVPRPVNALTGADAVVYGPPGPLGFAVPSVVLRSGAAVVRTDRILLLTVEAPPADGSA